MSGIRYLCIQHSWIFIAGSDKMIRSNYAAILISGKFKETNRPYFTSWVEKSVGIERMRLFSPYPTIPTSRPQVNQNESIRGYGETIQWEIACRHMRHSQRWSHAEPVMIHVWVDIVALVRRHRLQMFGICIIVIWTVEQNICHYIFHMSCQA